MLDKSLIGKVWPSYRVLVEKGRLRFFAKAIGEANPIYTDEAAAEAAGYRALPVPPTYLFCLENEVPDPFANLTAIGVDLRKLLHGEQRFRYHTAVCAGDVVTFHPRIADIYEKKGGALEFLVKETTVTDRAGATVAELRSVLVIRHG